MARMRTLRPEFFRSRSLARCSVQARVTFMGLWCEADDYGRGVADPRIIKGAVWPLDDEVTHDDVDRYLAELKNTGHIILYTVDDEHYFQVVSWEKHQAAAYRRSPPVHPAQPGVQIAQIDTPKGNREQVTGKETGSGQDDLENDFARFWECYPRKVAKGDAFRAYLKARKSSGFDDVMRGLLAWAVYWEAKNEPEFVPHPTTWLNQRRWDDEPPQLNGARASPPARTGVPSTLLSRSSP